MYFVMLGTEINSHKTFVTFAHLVRRLQRTARQDADVQGLVSEAK